MSHDVVSTLAIATWAIPSAGCLGLGVVGLNRVRAGERAVSRVVETTLACTFLSALALFIAFLGGARDETPVHLGHWFAVQGYAFELTLLVDWLSTSTTLLTTAILVLVARFAVNYLHREPGHFRFFWLVSLFTVGMITLTLSGSVDLLFAGWELVGVSSAILIAFFRERRQPVAHGLRAFVTYRICDASVLLGAVLLHHYAHDAEWTSALTPMRWPLGVSHLGAGPALLVALLFLFGAMGKSAQFPASGWLPRAMEGPTPSSALFYGALSVHAGVILLLRVYPLFNEAPLARVPVVIIGLVTAATAAAAGRVQSDAKNFLGYATLAQVGLMFVEIGLGFPRLAMLHLVANAVLRTWQMLRAPSALQESEEQRVALAGHAAPRNVEALMPSPIERRLWSAALSRFHVDAFAERVVAAPAMAVARAVRRLDERVNAWLWTSDHPGTHGPAQPQARPRQDSMRPDLDGDQAALQTGVQR